MFYYVNLTQFSTHLCSLRQFAEMFREFQNRKIFQVLVSCVSGREGLLPGNDRAGGWAAEARGPGQKEDLLLLLFLAPSQPPSPD